MSRLLPALMLSTALLAAPAIATEPPPATGQQAHSGLPLARMRCASGRMTAKAISQRMKLSNMGDTRSWTTRPTTALPAHISGAAVRKKMVEGVSFCCIA